MLHINQKCKAGPSAQHRGRSSLTVVAAHRARSKKQVACSRTLIAKPGHETEVAKLAGEIMQWTEEEAQQAAKGILSYQCVRDGWEANTFHFWERYETPTAFGTHSSAPRMVELMEKLRPHLEKPIGVSLYSYENGRLGPASMQEGPKGEGGLDDATGASGAAGGASMKQTSRAFDLTKVDEHEETERERELMSAMVGAEHKQAAGARAPGAGKAKDAGARAEAHTGSLPTSPAQLLACAAGLRDKVVSAISGLFRR